MKYFKRFLLVVFALIIALIVGFFLLVGDMMRHEIHTYKPFPFPPQKQLNDRLAALPTQYGAIGIEWYTYDNSEIDRSPYKLSIGLQDTSRLDHVLIERIEIISDRGNAYEVAQTALPLKLDITHSYQILEPAFHFDFDGGENIKTRIHLRFTLKTGEMISDILETDWRPIVVKVSSPIV